VNIFSFDPEQHRPAWDRQGWVHVPSAVHPEFLEELQRFVADRQKATGVLQGAGIKGAKGQYLYEPPAGVDLVAQLAEQLGPLCGLDAGLLTLSERHIKAYQHDADPDPPAHKDRRASQVAVGLAIEVPPGSKLEVYPETDVGPNPFLDAGLRDSLEADEVPEHVLRDAPCVVIEDAPGDLVAFRGSAVWHRRIRSAGTVNLYLKVNEFGSDPLGEDPRSLDRRARTESALAASAGTAGGLSRFVPVLSRRLEWFGVHHGHGGFCQPMAKVWEREAIPVSQEELSLLRSLAGPSDTPASRSGVPELEASLRRLARRGVIDLLTATSDGPSAPISPDGR
jgi:hypothetical protein